jgi:CBS domain-containing protein
VVDAEGRPIGLVSRADALLWGVEGGHSGDVLGDRISDASLPVTHPDDVVARAADLMIATDQGRIPVTDRKTGVLVGLVTRKDLLQVRADVKRSETHRQVYYRRGGRSVNEAPES